MKEIDFDFKDFLDLNSTVVSEKKVLAPEFWKDNIVEIFVKIPFDSIMKLINSLSCKVVAFDFGWAERLFRAEIRRLKFNVENNLCLKVKNSFVNNKILIILQAELVLV